MRRAESEQDVQRCLDIRRVVFIEGQNVPEHEEMDGLDGDCTHFLAFIERDGKAVASGTVRLRITDAGQAKLERLAVIGEARSQGLGRMLVSAVEAEATLAGHREVVLGAQLASLGFYERCGYVAEGPVFDDAGIDHRLMRRPMRD